MIIVSKERLKFLLAGREVDVDVGRRLSGTFRRGRIYAVGLNYRKTTCYAEVVTRTETPETTILRLRYAPAGADVPRMLARKSGYTHLSDPLDAGEALTDPELDVLAAENRERFNAARKAERDDIPLVDRLRDLERRAQAGDAQAQRHLFVIRQRVAAAEKQGSREAA